MTDDRKKSHEMVDQLLHAAASIPVHVPSDLMARVLADADHVQARASGSSWAGVAGILSRAKETLGGWAGLGGLAAASCTGFWIGVSPPQNLPDAGSILLGATDDDTYFEAVELSGFGWDMDGG